MKILFLLICQLLTLIYACHCLPKGDCSSDAELHGVCEEEKWSESKPQNVIGDLQRMPKFTLTYFDGRGLAEVSRWLFAVAEQPFDDVRITDDGDGEEWKKLKPTTPFGQLPVLEIDGFKLCQSAAIAAYLASEFGLGGKTNFERARIQMIYDCTTDMTKNLFAILMEQNSTQKAELKQKFEDNLKISLRYFENFVTNNGDTGYFVGDKLTLADIAFAVGLERLSDIQVDSYVENFPKLKHLNDNVRSHPKIAEWIAKRPVSSF